MVDTKMRFVIRNTLALVNSSSCVPLVFVLVLGLDVLDFFSRFLLLAAGVWRLRAAGVARFATAGFGTLSLSLSGFRSDDDDEAASEMGGVGTLVGAVVRRRLAAA